MGHAVASHLFLNLNSSFRMCVVQGTDEFETA